MENKVTHVKIKIDDLLIMKGVSKNGKPYEFIMLENDFRNNKQTIELLKQYGVKVSDNTPKATVATPTAEQGAVTLG